MAAYDGVSSIADAFCRLLASWLRVLSSLSCTAKGLCGGCIGGKLLRRASTLFGIVNPFDVIRTLESSAEQRGVPRPIWYSNRDESRELFPPEGSLEDLNWTLHRGTRRALVAVSVIGEEGDALEALPTVGIDGTVLSLMFDGVVSMVASAGSCMVSALKSGGELQPEGEREGGVSRGSQVIPQAHRAPASSRNHFLCALYSLRSAGTRSPRSAIPFPQYTYFVTIDCITPMTSGSDVTPEGTLKPWEHPCLVLGCLQGRVTSSLRSEEVTTWPFRAHYPALKPNKPFHILHILLVKDTCTHS